MKNEKFIFSTSCEFSDKKCILFYFRAKNVYNPRVFDVFLFYKHFFLFLSKFFSSRHFVTRPGATRIAIGLHRLFRPTPHRKRILINTIYRYYASIMSIESTTVIFKRKRWKNIIRTYCLMEKYVFALFSYYFFCVLKKYFSYSTFLFACLRFCTRIKYAYFVFFNSYDLRAPITVYVRGNVWVLFDLF